MFERELEKQLVLTKQIFLLPFGTFAEELREKETKFADKMILLHSRTTSQKIEHVLPI